MSWLAKLWWWLVGLIGLRRGFATEAVEDLPDVLEPDRVYLIGDGSVPWSAALLCPCRCGAVIQLSLIPSDRPRWSVSRHFTGSASLHPSIWRTKGCRSHFFLRRGRIVWAEVHQSSPTSHPR